MKPMLLSHWYLVCLCLLRLVVYESKRISKRKTECKGTIKILSFYKKKGLWKIMASSVSRFLLLFTLLSLLVGLMSQYFKAYLEFDNKRSIIKPIYDKHADSISICATFCGFGCKCFNFNLQTGMCRTYNSCNALYMTVNETGWRLYVDPPLNTNGKHMVFTNYSIYVAIVSCSM